MKKIHFSTSLGVLLNMISIVCLYMQYNLFAAILSLIAYFASLKEVAKYTSWYQFVTVFVSSLLIGIALEIPFHGFPFILLSCIAAGVGSILRIVFFRTFSYTGYSWYEPGMFLLALSFFLIGNFSSKHDWTAWVFPAPLILFQVILAWGIIKDKRQLLAKTQGGYKVQIGEAAADFELPDQNGEIVRLSDFRGKRHLLLIFVRGDWCPGCHMMLRTYEKNNDKFKSKNILVMAIGPDPVGVNRGMVERLGLDFRVLADEGQRIAMVYGVQLKEYDNDFAEKYDEGIPLPASFLIDLNGIVRYVSRPDKVGEFLNPSLIFPIVEGLDAKYQAGKSKDKAMNGLPEKNSQVAIDVTENNKLIADLRKQLSNYESIIDQANDSMLVIDIVDGKIHQSNPSAAKLLDYDKEELETLTLFDLHPGEYLQKSSAIVADVWEKGGLIFNDVPFKTKGGKLVPVECSAKVAPFAGRPAIVIYARDITERLRMETEINEQRRLIDEKNKDITDSIEYSKRIQRSIFLEKEKLKEFVPQSFIFFQPRDVVSGDFYWFTNYEIKEDLQSSNGFHYKTGTNILVVAAVDCTGHGVPGAFMSIIGNTLLNQTLNNLKVNSAANALDYVNAELKKALNKNNEDQPLRDGMDIALCCIDVEGKKLEYAGANNPVYIIRNKELILLKADKQPLTASIDSESKPFTNNIFELQTGDSIYLFTDGFADQFGGPHGKKFMYKKFKEALISIQDQSMDEQCQALSKIFSDWKGGLSQVDDVLVIGIRV